MNEELLRKRVRELAGQVSDQQLRSLIYDVLHDKGRVVEGKLTQTADGGFAIVNGAGVVLTTDASDIVAVHWPLVTKVEPTEEPPTVEPTE